MQLMGTAGLGLKRKAENFQMQQQHFQEQKKATQGHSTFGKMMKAKTLAEKRQNLQAEILRYGVAAIEKMYPRQAYVRVRVFARHCKRKDFGQANQPRLFLLLNLHA